MNSKEKLESDVQFIKMISEVSEEFNKKCNALTLEQFKTVMIQAIQSGDFNINLMSSQPEYKIDINNGFKHEHKQVVTYIPYRGCRRLQSEVDELQEIIKCYEEFLETIYKSDHFIEFVIERNQQTGKEVDL